jgi:hypothetical protein
VVYIGSGKYLEAGDLTNVSVVTSGSSTDFVNKRMMWREISPP